jgi:ATP-dependent protease ClpP protease subunit
MTAKEAVEFGIVDKIVEKRADAGVAGAVGGKA